MLERGDPHSRRYRCAQSYLLLTLVISTLFQLVTFVIETGYTVSSIGSSDSNDGYAWSWDTFYLVVTVVLFVIGLPLRIAGIRGATNERYAYVMCFAFGILIIYGLDIVLHVIFINYRLAVLLGVNLAINAIALLLALVFARRIIFEVKDEPLNDPMNPFH